jgi:ubiquinone/menaquinone biosynthesis C-methylase UbiE
MEDKNEVQVEEGSYLNRGYNTLERFVSYYYQIESIIESSPATVLEVGKGAAITQSYLRDLGIKVMTCDFDNSTKPDIVADIRKIPCEASTFDTVVAFQVLEHIPFADLGKAIDELCRISKKRVIISVPYRSSFFEFTLKIPGIRTIFKRNFLDFMIRIPLSFKGFETSGQHYWEIDSDKYKLGIVRKEILKKCDIVREFSPVLNKFHYFFVLKPKNIETISKIQ